MFTSLIPYTIKIILKQENIPGIYRKYNQCYWSFSSVVGPAQIAEETKNRPHLTPPNLKQNGENYWLKNVYCTMFFFFSLNFPLDR